MIVRAYAGHHTASKTPETTDNPLRRRLLASATAALAAGAAIATTAAHGAPVASAGSAGDDAELLERHADMVAAQAQMEAMYSEEQEEAFIDASDEWWGAFQAAVDLPAKTPEGIRAKAHMAQMCQVTFRGSESCTRDNFLDSLLADLLRGAAA